MPTNASLGEGIQRQLLDIFLFLGSEWILYLLLLLSVFSFAVAVERLVYFVRRSADVESMSERLSVLLAAGDLEAVQRFLAAKRTHVGTILSQGVAALDRGASAMEEVLRGATQVERLKMERGLAFLGTLGNNAPFIGLFGTVLGIIRSFRDLSSNTIQGSSAVMAGIADALVATAVGLLVALPAVAIFNAFQRAIRTQLATADALSRVLLAFAKTEAARPGPNA